MVTPATATTRARLTMVFQVSGRAWAASIAAAFAATDAGLPSPAAPPGGCRECPPAVTSWFIPVTSLQQPVPAQRDNHPHAVPLRSSSTLPALLQHLPPSGSEDLLPTPQSMAAIRGQVPACGQRGPSSVRETDGGCE